MARRGTRRIRDQNLTSEDTCEGRYPSPAAPSCTGGNIRRWAPAFAGACGGKSDLSPTNRIPGGCRGLLQKLRGASRARFRHPPESRGEETVFPHASSPTRSVWGPISERCPRNVLRGEGIAGVQCPSLIWRRPVMPPRPPMRSGVTPGVQTAPYPVISNHKSFQCGLRSVIRLILFFRR